MPEDDRRGSAKREGSAGARRRLLEGMCAAAACGLIAVMSPPAWAGGPGGSASAVDSRQDLATRESNKQTVLAFYKAFANYDFEGCSKYVGPYYLQHKSRSEEILGRELKDLEKTLGDIRQRFPGARLDVDYRGVFTLDDPNYVVMFVSTLMVGAGAAPPALPKSPTSDAAAKPRDMVHIFRLDHGKLVEHWDVTTN